MNRPPRRPWQALLVALAAAGLLAACSTSPSAEPGPVARGTVAGAAIGGRVDAPIARYYVEDYPRPHPDGWHGAIAAAEARVAATGAGTATLARVADELGSVDLAALLFIDHVRGDSANRAYAECMAAFRPPVGSVGRDERQRLAQRFRVLLAPGWLYRDQAQTEADFARTRAALDRAGIAHELAPTAQDGTVAENAAVLAARVRALADQGDEVIIVSASKSGAEVHYALGQLLAPADTRHVAAWINVGGLLRGTPLADRWTQFPRNLLARSVMAWHGWRWDSLRGLRSEPGNARFAAARVPDDLLVVNYIGVPLGSQLTHGATDRYRYLARFGPNDGATLLADARVPGGLTVVEPGADHYFHRIRIGAATLAMAAAIRHRLDGEACG